MSKPGEHKTVQARILKYAQEIGWTFVPRGEAEARRGKTEENEKAPPSLFFEDGRLCRARQGQAGLSAGIRPGYVILAVNGATVSSTEQLRDRVRQAGKKLSLLIERGDRKMFVPIRIG